MRWLQAPEGLHWEAFGSYGLISSKKMESLVKLAREYREAEDLETRTTIAEAIVCAVAPQLFPYLVQRVGQQAAEDVCQEATMAIVRNLRQFRGDQDKQFWKWCYHVARNKSADHLRRRSREPLTPIDPEVLWATVEASGQEEPISAGERLDLEYAMELLQKSKPTCYDLLWKHFILGWGYQEIALEQGATYDAVRVAVARCLKTVVSMMKKPD